jgi:hypothetical protein
MKGMWAVCFPKEYQGNKSREDIIDLFAEAGEIAEYGQSPRYFVNANILIFKYQEDDIKH